MSGKATFPIFSMINDFESKSFHIPEIKAQHRSLYYFLLGVLMHRRGANKFEIAYDYGMAGSKIGNHTTYTTALKELEKHKFLKYTPGKNRFSTPIIDLHFCAPTENLLQMYRESIGVSTVNNIKAIDTKEDIDTDGDTSSFGKPKKDTKQAIEDFDTFWTKYDKKVDRKKSLTRWLNISQKDRAIILQTVQAYVKANPDVQFRKNPLTYLNGECWKDSIPGMLMQPQSDSRKIIGYVPTYDQDDWRDGKETILSTRPIYEGDTIPVTMIRLKEGQKYEAVA